MSSAWSRMSLGRKAGYLFAALSLVLVFIAFTTPYWLASDPRVYSAQLLRLGLWETCFRSFAHPGDLNMEKFYVGCRWIFAYEYNTLRDFIEIRECRAALFRCSWAGGGGARAHAFCPRPCFFLEVT